MVDRVGAAVAATPSLFSLLRGLWQRLSSRRRRQLTMLLGLMFLSAAAEVISLGAILPFLGVLTAPEKVYSYGIVAKFAQSWGITSPGQLVLPLTIVFIVAVLFAAAVRFLVLHVNTRLSAAIGSDLSSEVYRRTLYQPYSVHLGRNSSEVISSLTSKVPHVVYGVLIPTITLISSTVVLVSIVLGLLVIDALVAIVAAACLGACYVFISRLSHRRLEQNSRRIAHESSQSVKALQEGLGGIRDVLIDGTQELYCDIYRRANRALFQGVSNNMLIGASPRFAMEAIGMTLIAALAYGLYRQQGGLGTALPVLGALAFGAQRLLPTLQAAYASWASVAGTEASLIECLDLLAQPIPDEALHPPSAPLPFARQIEFSAVRFRYGSDGPWVLDHFDFAIAKGARVGFVGKTGSGKSTMLDLVMGLLVPTEGEILVDGEPIRGLRRRAWQQTIAHVPQSIYLADSSLAENIAFGVPRESIDMERVRHAARQAQIAEFIESRPDSYDTLVGERGVRLSGGQRQRIAIARALYKQASVLIFDEATSALDNATEQAVIAAIESFTRELTIVLIAHRLTTVQRCDTIVEMAEGRVVAQGTYQQLLERSASFRDMANAPSREYE